MLVCDRQKCLESAKIKNHMTQENGSFPWAEGSSAAGCTILMANMVSHPTTDSLFPDLLFTHSKRAILILQEQQPHTLLGSDGGD
jgi:hypothetical protein